MLIPMHHTAHTIAVQPDSLVGDTWTTEVVPRLPTDLATQARTLKAFQRVRGVATPTDLLRAILASVLGALSTRRLGAWAVLVDLANISEAAWRKRLRASNAWLLWLLGALIAAPGPPPGPAGPAARRVRLIDATRLRHPGGTGDDWRVHFSYNFTAGRMDEVVVTDQHSAERLAHFTMQPGDIMVADNGYGYRSSVATAVRQDADVLLRITPATFPVETAAGQSFDLATWLRQGDTASQEWQGWCIHDAQREAVRVLAARLPPEATARARQRKYKQAQKHGRTPSEATLALADWVLVATTLAADWSLTDVLRLYRARWQVELVFKRMKQLLRFNQLRSTHRTTVEATVRALLVAWALQDGIVAELRALLPTAHPGAQADVPLVVSTWALVGLGLETLRHQVQYTWSQARLRACLPRLRRFLCSRPRRREHQETTVRAWLARRDPAWDLLEDNAA
jgi:hypothetical protein